MAAHRYWRILVTAKAGGGNEYEACEITMHDALGGANLCVGGVASASDYWAGVFGPPAEAFDGNPGTFWGTHHTSSPEWIGYDFGSGNAYDIIEFSWRASQFYGVDAPTAGKVQWSDDNAAWTDYWPFATGAWANWETKTFSKPGVPSTAMQDSAARVFSVFSLASQNVRSSGARSLAVYNFPSEAIEVSGADLFGVVKRNSPIEIAEARVFAIVKGRTANPKVRAWTFTLDGHDFYVLRLGDEYTLIYDTASEQWVEWDSADSGAWRPNIGANWVSAQALAHQYGSNVVAGDDTFGLLWFLDPDQPYDDAPDKSRDSQQLPFSRVVTGQVLAKGRQFLPCYAIFLDGDNYGLSGTEFTPAVVLETSDDQGRTWEAHDTLTVPADYDQQNAYEWTSLGQISSPGRLFRVTDNGVFARIDTMGMNDDAG